MLLSMCNTLWPVFHHLMTASIIVLHCVTKLKLPRGVLHICMFFFFSWTISCVCADRSSICPVCMTGVPAQDVLLSWKYHIWKSCSYSLEWIELELCVFVVTFKSHCIILKDCSSLTKNCTNWIHWMGNCPITSFWELWQIAPWQQAILGWQRAT